MVWKPGPTLQAANLSCSAVALSAVPPVAIYADTSQQQPELTPPVAVASQTMILLLTVALSAVCRPPHGTGRLLRSLYAAAAVLAASALHMVGCAEAH
jgi:hypothetical protein